MIQKYAVVLPATLESFLLATLVGARRKRISQLLKFKSVTVNGAVISRGTHALSAGDTVEIHFGGRPSGAVELAGGLRIVYEDDHLLVVDKPAGLLTIATEHERERTAYAMLTDYVRNQTRGHSSECGAPKRRGRSESPVEASSAADQNEASVDNRPRVFIVHRLDRDTSGLLVLARTDAVKRALQSEWKQVEKRYLAVVEGVPKEPGGTIRSRLRDNAAMRVYSTGTEEGEPAVTHYRVIRSSKTCSLLEITLETGRKNQIRVHLSDLGHPIVGDRKYGAHSSPARRLGLHAGSLTFTHPVTGERRTYMSPLPSRLQQLLGSATT